jgi:phosphopantothenoylcysteine decarboxylase/phosphopantothenate--cysteine ligase
MSPKRSNGQPFVVLGVAGGIAAYKSVELLRLLRQAGAHVAPVLTPDATRFVGALTFSALASEPARTTIFNDHTTPIPHTYLGQNADVIVVAPATAHVIARLAAGLGDDLLTATVWASRAPVILCPAMHTEMWEQPSVQENLSRLRARGYLILPPDDGALAGGDSGPGRLPDPETIAQLVMALATGSAAGPLSGHRVVITAGGTREPIDAVRVITNLSSGRQGHALAQVAARWGGEVDLITTSSEPLALDVARLVNVIRVNTAAEMHDAVMRRRDGASAIIMAAAVADFTVTPVSHKLKKADGIPAIDLTPTVDILATLGQGERGQQVLVGFAAETSNLVAAAIEKCQRKNCDFVIANNVADPEVGFEHPTNEVTIVDTTGVVEVVSLRGKEQVAVAILDKVASKLSGRA